MTGAGRKRLRVVVANRPCRHLRIASEVTIWTFVNRDFLLAFTLEPTPSLPSGGQYLFLGAAAGSGGSGNGMGLKFSRFIGKNGTAGGAAGRGLFRAGVYAHDPVNAIAMLQQQTAWNSFRVTDQQGAVSGDRK